MKGNFDVDRGLCTTMQEGKETTPALEANQPERAWKFVTQMEQVLGENTEPDPLFFVESWTIGVPAAIQNFLDRQPGQKNYKRPKHPFRDLGTPSFPEVNHFGAEFHSSARTLENEYSDKTGWRRQPVGVPALYEDDTLSRETFADEVECIQELIHAMTTDSACRILGVTSSSTREELRAQYRKRASRNHPDRLGRRTEKERQLATDRMALINEAYRMLRRVFFNETA